ncbi:MAG: hypothetical protein WCL44_09100 [bacterium]
MRVNWPGLAAVSLLSLVLSFAVTYLALGRIDVNGLFCGWVVAVSSSAAGLLLDLRSVGADSRSFFLYGMLGKGVRFLLVAGLAIVFFVLGGEGRVSFAMALVIGYLAAMVHEVWTLYLAGLTGTGGRPGGACGDRPGAGK